MTQRQETTAPFDEHAEQEADALKAETIRLMRLVEVDDLKWLMGHKQGRRIVWRMLDQYGVYRSSFRNDPLEMAFAEGNRNHGLRLIADTHEHCPERYSEMLNERKKDVRSNRNPSTK